MCVKAHTLTLKPCSDCVNSVTLIISHCSGARTGCEPIVLSELIDEHTHLTEHNYCMKSALHKREVNLTHFVVTHVADMAFQAATKLHILLTEHITIAQSAVHIHGVNLTRCYMNS